MRDVIFRKSAHEIIAVIVALKISILYDSGVNLLITYFDAVAETRFFCSSFEVFEQKLSLLIKAISCSHVDEDIEFGTVVFLDQFSSIVFCPFRFITRSKVTREGL